MKNLFKNSAILTIAFLTFNTGLRAEYESQMVKPSDASPSLKDRAKAWYQDTKSTITGDKSQVGYFERAKSWLSEKLGIEVNPEEVKKYVEDIKRKISNATPEQKAELHNKIQQKKADLENKMLTATADQKAKLREALSYLRNAVSEKLYNRPAMQDFSAMKPESSNK